MPDNLFILGVIAIIAVGTLALLTYNTGAPIGQFPRPYAQYIPWGCTDTDGGMNPNVTGTCSTPIGYRMYTDRCTSDSKLEEYFCETRSKCSSTLLPCEYGCSRGACFTERQYWCTDTDGGIVYDTQGTVTTENGEYGTDWCDGNTLREYYCVGIVPEQEDYDCPYTCLDGACSRGIID